MSYGIFGLIDAIEKFDLERAIKFETYAIARIKGAIIDELRSIDWIPRSVRYKAREVEKAYAALEGRLHRSPTEPEVAEEMGISLEELHAIFSQVSFVNVVALDELISIGGERGDKLTLVDTLEDTKAEDPVQAFESEETKYLLARAINTLPEREKIVVTLYYYEGLTLAEIGQVLGVTESRICQMHTKAVLQLRSRLADQRGGYLPPPAPPADRAPLPAPAPPRPGTACPPARSAPPEARSGCGGAKCRLRSRWGRGGTPGRRVPGLPLRESRGSPSPTAERPRHGEHAIEPGRRWATPHTGSSRIVGRPSSTRGSR